MDALHRQVERAVGSPAGAWGLFTRGADGVMTQLPVTGSINPNELWKKHVMFRYHTGFVGPREYRVKYTLAGSHAFPAHVLDFTIISSVGVLRMDRFMEKVADALRGRFPQKLDALYGVPSWGQSAPALGALPGCGRCNHLEKIHFASSTYSGSVCLAELGNYPPLQLRLRGDVGVDAVLTQDASHRDRSGTRVPSRTVFIPVQQPQSTEVSAP